MPRFWLTALLALVGMPGFAQIKSNGLHPAPMPYLLEHFGLYGPVESIITYGARQNLMTNEFFDRSGRITKSIDFSGMTSTTRYVYDAGQPFIRVFRQSAQLPESEALYQTNGQGQLINYLHKVGDPLRTFVYSDGLLVKDTSANRYSNDKRYYSYYTYDKQKRLATAKHFNGGDVLSREETYAYQDRVVTIQGKAHSAYAPTSSYEKKLYYTHAGWLTRSTFTSDGKTEAIDFQLDAFGNWVSKTGGVTRVIKYYDKSTKINQPASVNPPATIPNKPASSTLLDESFDNNQRNWGVWDNDGAAVQITQGAYRFRIKQRNNFLSWYGGMAELSANQTKDFVLKAGFSLGTTDTGNPNDSYWLLWGLGNQGKDYYAFGIYPEGKFQYGRLAGNSWDAKAGSIASPAVRSGPHQRNELQVEKRGDSIYFFVNSRLVHRDRYESFPTSFTGLGFQFNNPKLIDVEYLQASFLAPRQSVGQTPVPAKQPALSPAIELAYQTALQQAPQSIDRANALMRYLNELQSSGLSDSVIAELFQAKCTSMRDIDFYALFELRLLSVGKSVSLDRTRQVFGVLNKLLTKEQSNVMDFYLREVTHQPGVQVYNQTTGITETITRKLDWPSNAPRPGYGWNKLVSSNPATLQTNTSPQPALTPKPVPVPDEFAAFQARAKSLESQTVYLHFTKTCYALPRNIQVTQNNDMVVLEAIGAKYSYSYSSGKNQFGTTLLKGMTQTMSMRTLLRMIDRVQGAYQVMEIGPCGHCAGGGGSWDNQSKTKGYCTHCNGTGCAPTQIWNNGASRRF